MDIVLIVEYKKGCVECGVDFPHFRKAKLVCDWGQDLDDGKGSFSLWSELWVGDRAFEISGFQPDFVAFGKSDESSVVT